jgi:hypothetical protein
MLVFNKKGNSKICKNEYERTTVEKKKQYSRYQ